MKNFISQGDTLTFTATADVASGDGVLVGSLFGVATGAVKDTETGTLKLTGVFDLPKAGSQAWTVGALIYWTGSACTNVASSNKLIGVAIEAVAGGANDKIGRVRLNGAGITA